MSLFNKFTDKVQGTTGRSEAKYGLNEILAILDMANNDVSKEDISKITGRSKDSLNYKIFEGQTTINGKTNVRSVKKHWFAEPTKKGSEMRSTEDALKSLFTAFGEEYKGEEDIQARIDAYAASRDNTEAAG